MADYQRPQQEKTVFDFDKLTISTAGSPAKLKFGIYNNNPRLMVYTNDPNDKADYGKITAALDPYVFNVFLEQLNRVALAKEPVEFLIDNKGYDFRGGKRSEQMVVQTSIRFGKNDQGVVWISVEKPNRPKIIFEFGYSMYHVLAKADGTPLAKSDTSKLFALATIKALTDIYNTYLVTDYKHVVPPQKNNNNNNQSNNNNGGYNNQSNARTNNTYNQDMAEEDFPF